MKEKNYWDEFLCTGSIDDYLEFKSMQNETSLGENPHAGASEADRNGVEDGAYRGIR